MLTRAEERVPVRLEGAADFVTASIGAHPGMPTWAFATIRELPSRIDVSAKERRDVTRCSGSCRGAETLAPYGLPMHEARMAMRIQLPNQPNTLARIAAALGELQANILFIDVHELDGADVVDEIVIAGPESLSPASVRASLLEAGAHAVISVPLVHRQMDALARALTSVASFARDASDDALIVLIPSIVPIESASIEPVENLDEVDPGGRQLRTGTPAARSIGGSWVLAVPRVEQTAVPFDALVVRRSIRFSATEVSRLRSLLLLHAHLSAASNGPVRPQSTATVHEVTARVAG